MRHLGIDRARLFGWSYGGLISMLIALRRPELVGRVATYGTLFGPPQDGIRPDKFGPPVEQTPDGLAHGFARDHYRRVAPDPNRWPVYVHCAAGKDRTGYAVATYRIVEQGWDADSAIEEMFDFRYNPIWFGNPAFLRHVAEQRAEVAARVARSP